MENAFCAEVLRERGWNTFWGKNHNIPVDEFDMGASKRNWPLARGFDRFYGFIAARPTSGIPTWSRTTTTPTSRTRPRRATTSQGPGGQGDRLHPRL
jgi:arylsulfatase A-like enzyme